MARMHLLICALPSCRKQFPCSTGRLRRAQAIQAPLYCSQPCSGLARRNGKTLTERREEKRAYDMEYRATHGELLKQKKHDYWQANKHRFADKQAAYRQEHRAEHRAYCQQPSYKAYKHEYDQHYLARKHFGSFGEAVLVLRLLEAEIRQQATKTELATFKATLNKALQRRRAL